MVRFSNSPEEIARAARLLRDGGLVAFPTETVYGLGARADDPDAVARIFAAKGRPANHPLIVHLPHAGHLVRWAREVPVGARTLADQCWPGPLTLILPRHPDVPDAVTGGQDTVGLRVPQHPIALALIRETGTGVAAPSANRFGHVSPTTADHVIEELGDRIDGVVDGGPCKVGIESTIVDFSGPTPAILRPGQLSAAKLEEVLGMPLVRPREKSPRAPGTLESHYAPSTRVVRVSVEELEEVVVDSLGSPNGTSIAVIARRPAVESDKRCHWITMPKNAADYARELYAALRQADQAECGVIIVENVPSSSDWEAIRDRLRRASAEVR